jgi:hypothetical protein
MKRFFLCLFILVPFLSQAQTNFKPGYLINNAGDSIPGFIRYNERNRDPSSFTFETTVNGPSKTYQVSDAKAYGLTGIVDYKRFAVDVSQSKEALKDLPFALDSTFIRDTVFLRVVQVGKKLSLYSYSDHIKTRFYIKEPNASEPRELIYTTYRMDERGTVKEYNKYIRQLTELLLSNNLYTPENQRKMQSLTYNQTQILGIVSLLNDQKPEKGMKSTRFFIGAAFNTSNASYTGGWFFDVPGITNKRSFAPMLMAGFDFYANPHVGRMLYRVELSYTTAKSDIYAPDTDPTIAYKENFYDSYSLIFTPQGIWNVVNKDKLKVFIGAGVSINRSRNQNISTLTKVKRTGEIRTEKESDFTYVYIAPQVSGGIVLNRHFEVFGNYMFAGEKNDYYDYKLSMARINIGLKYLFGHTL